MKTSQNSNQKAIEILLVEDSPDDALLTVEAFKESKLLHHLTRVEDGVEALDFLYQRKAYPNAVQPDMILLDLNLPRKNGREVLAEIKSDPDLMHIPVVVLTTSKAEEDILKTYDLHANCYITKPVSLDRFIDVVKSIEGFWLTVAKLPGNRELVMKPGIAEMKS